MEPDRLNAALASAIAGVVFHSIRSAATLFGVPPPDRQIIARTIFEIFLAIPMGMVMGYGFAGIVSVWLTSLVSGFTKGVVFDPIAAGILLGIFSIKGLQLIFDVVLEVAADRLKNIKGANDGN